MNRCIPSNILTRLHRCRNNLKQAKANVQGRLDTLEELSALTFTSYLSAPLASVNQARQWLRVDNEILALSQKHYDRALSRYNEAAD